MQDPTPVPVSRKETHAEIKLEMAFRRKTWQTIGRPQEAKFMDMNHRKRYAVTDHLLGVLEVMTDREWYEFYRRMKARRVGEEAKKQSLFSTENGE